MDRIVAVILAAGSSSRLGFNKLCLKIDGETVIRRTVRLFLECVEQVVVVTGFERERIERELKGFPVLLTYNPDHLNGMSSSVKTALPHITGREGILFHLGDKPLVSPDTVAKTIETFRQGSAIVLPVFNGIKGHPVLVRSRLFLEEMAAVQGDMGLRKLVERHAHEVRTVEGDEGTILDIDSEEDIAELARRGFTIEKS